MLKSLPLHDQVDNVLLAAVLASIGTGLAGLLLTLITPQHAPLPAAAIITASTSATALFVRVLRGHMTSPKKSPCSQLLHLSAALTLAALTLILLPVLGLTLAPTAAAAVLLALMFRMFRNPAD